MVLACWAWASAFGEGTFELRQGAAATDEVFLEGSLAVSNANYDQHRVTFLRVDVFDPNNEVIDLYGEALGGSPDVQIWCPGGLPLPTPDAPYSVPTPDFTADFTAAAGELTSFADVVSVQSEPRGIAPVTYTLGGSRPSCGDAGVYTIRYASAGIDTNGQEFWDVRVRNTASGSLESGRVWSDKFALSMGRPTGQLGAQLYVVAGEDRGADFLGVTWLLDLADIAPFGFQLYANARGIGPAQYNYRSIGGSASPQPELDPEYPIYLNPPAKPVTTPGLVGSIDAVEPACTPGVSTDVVIRFETQGTLPYTIRVDEDNDSIFSQDEVIVTGGSVSGTNTVVWDGILPSGASIAPGNSYAIELTLSTGEVHFPFYDVENANPGPIITPFSIAPSATTELYFWDDTDPSITSGAGGGTTSGPDGSLSTHNWANGTLGYNDENMIDTWKYASVQRADQVYIQPLSCASEPGIGLAKAGELLTLDSAGTAGYAFTFRLENTGNVDLTNVQLVDDLSATFPAPVGFSVTGLSATGGLVSNPGYDGSTDTNLLDAAASSLALGEVGFVTLNVDVDFNGEVGPFSNTATASGEDGTGTPVSDISQDGVDPDPDGNGVPDESDPTPIPMPAPTLDLLKALAANDDADGSGSVSLGDTLTYTVTATNAGNVTLTGVQVTDTRIAPASATCASVLPGDDCVLTGTYTVTQTDVDAGAIANTGRAEADQVAPVEDVLTTPVPQNPALTLVKTGAVDDGGDGVVDAGDTIDYAFTVTNDGNVTLTDITLTDPLVAPSGGPLAALAPGASDSSTFTATYTLTQADIDAGSFTNTATANSDQGASDQDGDTRTLAQNPALTLVKTGVVDDGGDGVANAGDTIDYVFTIINDGNVTLTDITLTDPLVALSGGPLAALAPGASDSTTFTASYTLTQADIDAGSFTNTATANSDEGASEQDSDTRTLPPVQSISLDKTVTGGAPYDAVGDVITYSFLVTNTGNVPLTGPVTIDDALTADETCPPLSSVGNGDNILDPAESIVCTASHPVSQADLDAGSVSNSATAFAEGIASNLDTAVATAQQSAALDTVKALANNADEDGSGDVSLGDTLTYTVTVTNTGNVTLTGVTLTDTRIAPSSESCASVAPGDACVLTGTYTVTQSDVDAGQIVNTGTGDSNETDPISVQELTPIGQGPALDTAKALTDNADEDGSGDVSLGDTLTYTVTVTNTGNVTLTGVEVTDTRIAPSSESCASVAPGDACVLTGTYTVTQSDVDAGQIVNTGTGDSNETDPISTELDTPVPQSVSLDTLKALSGNADEDGSGDVSLDDTLTYTVTVTNTGNVTLTGVTVTDSRIAPSSESCASVAPGDECVLTGTYTVTQSDVDAGQIVNTGTGDSDEAGPITDQLDTPVGQNSAIAIVKTATFNDENGDGFGQVGETIDYAFEVTNTGSVTLTNVVVTDPLLTVNGGPLASLAVGASDATTFTGTYTLTQADLDNGQVENQATATGQDPDGQPVSDVSDDDSPAEDDPTVTPLGRDSALSLTKQASLIDDNVNGAADVGETIDYTLTAVNSGSVTLADVVIDDPRLPALDCTPSQPVELAPGASLVCTGGYTVAQADIDAGGDIVNTATATAPDPDDPNAPPLEDSDTTGTGVCAVDTGSIAGTVWEDLNRDNVIDADEARYPSFLTLGAPGAAPEQLTVSTASTAGAYTFDEVPAGTYELRILEAYLGNNFDLYAIQPPVRTVTVTRCGSVTEDFNFGAPEDGVIGDFVWFDANEDQAVDEFRDADNNGVLTENPIGASFNATEFEWVDLNMNGVPNDGEFRRCGLADVRVDLFDGNGSLVDSRRTNLRGEYFFRGLALGQAYTAEVNTADPANLAAAQQFAVDGNCIELPAPAVAAGSSGAAASRGAVIAGCGNTTPLSVTSTALTAAAPVDDDLDFGLVCGVAGAIDLDKVLTANADEDGSGDVSPGDTLSYTITAMNTGSVALSGVVVTDTRITPSSRTCATLAQGASCVLVGSYVVTASDRAAGVIVNTATADSNQTDPVSTDLATPVSAPPPPGPPNGTPVPVPATGLLALLALLAGLLTSARHRLGRPDFR